VEIGGEDTESVLEAANRIPVSAGDTVFVPAGLPHAIGAGILLVELQEPTDFSIFL
jgi:mannose-6-phosphate isomerase